MIKNLRYNWLTEKTGTIRYPDPSSGEFRLACWEDLRLFYKEESEQTFTKRSKLTNAALYPSNLEKQKVSLALQVFCDETSAALKTATTSCDSWKSKAAYIDQVTKLWKVVNCKSKFSRRS